jgi:hypothetical protein
MLIWGRVKHVDGAESFSPYDVITARIRATRYVLRLDGSASDAAASTSTCPFNLGSRASEEFMSTVDGSSGAPNRCKYLFAAATNIGKQMLEESCSEG